MEISCLSHKFHNASVPQLAAAVGVTGQGKGLCNVLELRLPARDGFIGTAAG